MLPEPNRPKVRVVTSARAPSAPLGDAGSQRVLLGEPCGDVSPMLMGITSLLPDQTSPLLEPDTAEMAYVIAGSGWMIGDGTQYAFTVGDAILIEPRCWHAIRSGNEGVGMLYVFPTAAVPPTRSHTSSARD